MPSGAAVSYVSGGAHRPLPAPSLTPAAHRPWCSDCKKKFDATDLDEHGLCPKCVHAAETRAAAAERRAADPSCDQIWEDAKKAARKRTDEQTDNVVRRGRRARPETPEPALEEVPERVPPVASPAPPRVRAKVAAVGRSEVVITLRAVEGQEIELVAVSALLNELLAGLQGKAPKVRRAPAPEKARRVREHNGPQRIVLPSPEVEQAYADGATLAELAAKYEVSSPTIARHLDDHGVVRRQQRVSYTPEFLEQIRAAYVDEGLTQAQVAERLGLTTKVVQTAMDRAGIEARESASVRSANGVGHPIKLDDAAQAEIVRRYSAGEAASVVAAAYDVTRASIYHVLDKFRVPRHGARPPGSGHDGAAGLKQQLAGLAATSREIKQWALEQGLVDHIARGVPAQRLVDAYTAAHPDRCASSAGSPTSDQIPDSERTSA